jgi:hypothetical protein
LTINQKALTITADARSTTYGTALVLGTAAYAQVGLVNNDSITGVTLKQATNSTVPGTQGAGTYSGATDGILASAAQGTGLSNYDITYVPGTLTINKATLTVTADDKTRVYGDNNPSLTYVIAGYVNSQDATSAGITGTPTISTTATASSNVTTYAITSAANDLAAANYQFSYVDGTLTVNRRPIIITADAGQNKVYGNANSVLNYVVESNATSRGLFNNDTFSGALSRASGENVGSSYAITQGTLNNNNYAITLVSSNFAITPRPISLSADAKTKTYGDNDPTFTATITSGTLATVAVSDSLLDVTGTMTRAAGNNVGQYAIALGSGQGTGSKSSNYDITYTPNNLTINKARLTATGTKEYSGQIEFEAANLTVAGVGSERFTVSGNATMLSKHVQTNQRLANVLGLTISEQNNGLLSNYESLEVGDTRVSVTPRVVNFSAPTINKVYDGGYTYTATSGNTRDAKGNCMSDLCRMSQNLVGGDQVTNAAIIFAGNDKNVGTGKLVNVTDVTINDGNNGNNYIINRTNGLIASSSNSNITPAPLTVQAVNDARFVGLSDSTNFGGAIINGFVGGESFLTLGGTLSIQRSNSSINDAGTYTGVLVPNITSNTQNNRALGNYSITYRNGNYTIVPAQSLLVKVSQAQATVYGETPNYTITAQYFLSNAQSPVNLTAIDNGLITVRDGLGSEANFAISAQAALSDYSSSGRLSAGGYNLVAAGSTVTGANFRSMTLVGSLTIKPREISASSLGIQSVTKVYDGTTNINSQSIIDVNRAQSQVRAGDQVAILATGSFADKNVGINKSVTIDVSLSGIDAKNYTLPIDVQTQQSNGRFVSNIGTITQLDSVEWTGAANDGRWSNSGNWANGALPDQANVRTVNIGAGKTVTFDSALVGQVNSNIVNNGAILFNGANDFTFNSNVSGAGSISHSNVGVLTISGNNSYSGGTTVSGSSRLVLGSATALGTGALNMNGGYLTLQSGITLAGNLTVNGDFNLMSDINTSGNQTYNGAIRVHGGQTVTTKIYSVKTIYDNLNQVYLNPEIYDTGLTEDTQVRSFVSANGNITFNGTVKAHNNDSPKKISLSVDANEVTINQNIGGSISEIVAASLYQDNKFGFDKGYFFNLTINDQKPNHKININADIITAGNQKYGSAVIVGDNGSNGFTRTLISLDPSITFASTIDDSVVGIHTLITKSILDSSVIGASPNPFILFNGVVGGNKKLLSLQAEVVVRNNNGSEGGAGTLFIRESVYTRGDQNYTAESALLGNGSPDQVMSLSSDGGNVNFNLSPPGTNGGVFVAGLNLNLLDDTPNGSLSGLSNRQGSNTLNVLDYKRPNPSAGLNDSINFLTNINRMMASNSTNIGIDELLVGSVNIGDIEDESDKLKCDVNNDDNCSFTL